MAIRDIILSFFLFLFFITYSFSQTPLLRASGNQLYCPLSSVPVVTDISLQNFNTNSNTAIYIQISEGYDNHDDFLELIGNHSGITSSWDSNSGKLSLSILAGISIQAIEEAIAAVNFSNSDPNFSGERVFSITTGQANYLASTGHYYEYVSDLGISWNEARNAAENRTYYGLQGYLATITSQEEAQLTGEQANGAGWLGGTDEDNEGVWKWVTGPEGSNGGLVFWNGGTNGSTPNYANWNVNQPDNAHGGPGEDYLHITDPTVGRRGAWNDLRVEGDPPNVPEYHPKGYIVEYGGMPDDPEINISASTSLHTTEVTTESDKFICGPQEVTLSADASEGIIYWFDTATGGTPVFEGKVFTTSVNGSTDYFVSAGPENCYSKPRKKVSVTFYNTIDVEDSVTLSNCLPEGNSESEIQFDLNNAIPILNADSSYQYEFYNSRTEAEDQTDPLASSIIETNNSSNYYIRISNNSPCYKIVEINIEISSIRVPPNFEETITICDDDGEADGIYNFSLEATTTVFSNKLPQGQNFKIIYYYSEDDALNKNNPISDDRNFQNDVPGDQSLYVRIERKDSDNSCYAIGPFLNIKIENLPNFDLNEIGQLCGDNPSYIIDPINPSGEYSYEWYNENADLISNQMSLEVVEPGFYSVKAVNQAGCESELKTIEVVDSSPAYIDRNNIKITSTGNTYQIEILNPEDLGLGDYEYALDNPDRQYQKSEIFSSINSGAHVLFVRDRNGCGTSSINLFLFGIPEFFTPNNDGHNDYWNVAGVENPQNYHIIIFDRYGKVLKEFSASQQGWDGTYNGKMLPAEDYWYQLSSKNGMIRKGHFSLIR